MKRVASIIDKYGYGIYPILFALFPLLSFYGANSGELQSESFPIWTFVIFNFVVAAVCWLTAWVATRSSRKASILALVLMASFFSFGRIHSRIQDVVIQTPVVNLGPTKLLLLANTVLLIVVWLWLRRLSSETTTRTNKTLTFVSLAMVGSTVFTILPALVSGNTQASVSPPATQDTANASKKAGSTPDIYYILLDGYARADVLKENFNYDNSEFINTLRNKGFYVADQAHSNYAHTHFSVPSTFNMRYLDDLTRQMGDESTDRTPLKKLIDQNEVVSTLKSHGYKYIQIGSQWGWTEKSPSADIIIPTKTNSETKIFGIRLDEFAQVYLQTTAMRPWLSTSIRDTLVAKTLGAFERTEEVPAIDDPTLTFTHIVSPHPPYLFDRNGTIEGQTKLELDNHGFSDREKFVEQTRYVNKRMIELVDKVLKDSNKPPIIIVASDHGPASSLNESEFLETDLAKLDKKGIKERMGILNAYYFPDQDYSKLSPSITPVNSLRVVLSQYLGQDMTLLTNKIYFSSNSAYEYRFLDVTDFLNESN